MNKTQYQKLLRDMRSPIVPSGVARRHVNTILKIAETYPDGSFTAKDVHLPESRLNDLVQAGLAEKFNYYSGTSYQLTTAGRAIVTANN
jgi:hypothetical protein